MSKLSIGYSPQFKRDVKQLFKKYRQIRRDVNAFIEQLKQGETPGDQIPGAGYTVYKVRLKNSDLSKGKRGGYRLIYYLKTAERIILITIYAKSEQADISPDEIRRIIEDLSS